MRSRTSLAIIVLAVSVLSACSRKAVDSNSPIGAISSNRNTTTKLFERRSLHSSGFRYLNDFILPEVRQRLDTEPVGDSDVYVAQTYEVPNYEPNEQEPFNEENPSSQLELEKAKYLWASKKYGEAVKADATATGTIIFYADETYYDLGRLEYFVGEGRDRLATDAGIEPARVQVIYGGYRGMAQVEMWVVPAGQQQPTPKPESRDVPPDKEL